jgi:hypothetical protein
MILLGVPFILSLCFLYSYIYEYGNVILNTYIDEYILYYKLAEYVDLDEYKRKYIIKNIFKSTILALILIPSTLVLYDGFINNVWSNLVIKFIGCIYVSLDLSGLVYVQGLPITTVIHHLVVCVFGILNLYVDYEDEGYYRSLLIYTYFSIIPFIVNFYLGYRYLSYDQLYKKGVAYIAMLIYGVSLVINIICQLVFFYNSNFSYSIILYLGLFSLIFNDDIKLIKFLNNETKKI